MSAIQIITKIITTDAGVKAVLPAKSVYPVEASQRAEPPYAVLNVVSRNDGMHLDGADEYPEERISVAIVTKTATTAIDIGDAIMATLQCRIKETIGAFKDIDTRSANIDLTQASDDRQSFMRTLHFMVRWRKRT